ncbi:MAG: AAA family ATPase, partial [Hyphomicrobiaceae bacterium]|nr:AAA family ATPase [Hyphomicrobiaceae bacterium]
MKTKDNDQVTPSVEADNAVSAGGGSAGRREGDDVRRTAKIVAAGDKVDLDASGQKIRAMLRGRLGEEVFVHWFNSLEFDRFDGKTLFVSVAVKFLRNWIQSHYFDDMLACARLELKNIENIDISVRQPGAIRARKPATSVEDDAVVTERPVARPQSTPIGHVIGARPQPTPTTAAGFEGSPIDPRYTFDSFVVGAANRMAHAGASQVAETLLGDGCGFNPLYIHSAVGLGKTHLLQAIAWEVRRRTPQAQVLYLTAEQFRFRFVEALQSKGALAFKDRFRSIDMLLIDDLEFLHGQHTEQEFDHIINAMLDGGKQVVVASARAPNAVDRLSDRMRTRLQRGLVTELAAPDYELRRKIIDRRVQEKRHADPSFEVPRDVQDLLAERLTENG